MKRLLITLMMACACGLFVSAQEGAHSVTGLVVDTASAPKLATSSIVLVHAKDSMFYRFTRTAGEGKFTPSNLDRWSYMLYATSQQYTDCVERFTWDRAPRTLDYGRLGLVVRS